MMTSYNYYIIALAQNFSTLHTEVLTKTLNAFDVSVTNTKNLQATTNGTVLHSGIKITIQSTTNIFKELQQLLLQLPDTHKFDVSVQKADQYSHNRKLICFDMDSTIISQEVIVELAKEAGIGEQVEAITESAMRGEINFNESFKQRVALLEGLPIDVLDSIANRLTINQGGQYLLQRLKQEGYYTAILSGGFTYFAQFLQQQLGFDEVHANVLDIHNGKVTGKTTPPIVDGAKKAEILQNIAKQQNIALEQVVAVGDGANDLDMMNVAGMGVAYKAKPLVRNVAPQSINHLGLDSLLHLLHIDY